MIRLKSILRSLLNSTTVLRSFLPLAQYIGSPAFRRKALERLPFPTAAKALAHLSDDVDSKAMRIVQEKKEALAKGEETTRQLVSSGKDIMSALRECAISFYQH